MPFQGTVNQQLSPAVEGDFASDNPRNSMDAGPGQIITDIAVGLFVGRFCWVDVNGVAHNAYPSGASPVARLGIAPREGNEFPAITAWLGVATLLLPPGIGVTVMTTLDMWARLASGTATVGQKAFASYVDGTVTAGAAGVAKTAAITGNIASGAATLANLSAAVVAGQPVSGTGIPVGTVIITGAGIAGTATMSANATATTTALAVTAGIAFETPWFIVSGAASGELVKISRGG